MLDGVGAKSLHCARFRPLPGRRLFLLIAFEWHKKLAKEGYDGIMETNGEVIIFNPDKFKITK